MSFEHEGLAFNLLDTPGHQDFSEDTYCTRTAVDSAIMMLDAYPEGAEGASRGRPTSSSRSAGCATCRSLSCSTKLDRQGRDPVDPLHKIKQSLALDVTPAWRPIAIGRDFLGTYDLFADALLLFERGIHDQVTEPVR
jgi:peptide chain release factor 3